MSSPTEPPPALPQPSRPNHDEGIHLRGNPASSLSKPSRNSFLLGTIILGAAAWLIVLISQSLVAATISNASVRIVWFGFIIQTLLLILVIEIFLCDMTIAYGLQISIFATLATVFAVIGVDQNIYLSQPAAKAVGAGWLLTAIVNLIWIIYFTSPPESPFLRVADIINAPGPSRPPTMIHTVEKIGRSQDAFLMSPQGANSVHKGLNVDAGDQGNVSRADRAHTGEANPSSLTASNQWNLYQRPARDTLSASAARSERSGPREQSMVMSDHGSARPDSGAAGDVVLQPIPAPIDSHVQTWKAQALFDYNGSPDDPNELIFKKHEILVITDKSGKWWEATASDGRKGIAPSNYLKLVQ